MDDSKKIIREFGPTTLALKNKNTVYLLIFIITVFGSIAYTSLPKELFPEVSIPTILVQTTYPGNPPESIENLISRPLEKELKMKADWTSMLVHELRSPLTAILGYSELMAIGNHNDEVTTTSQLISHSTDRMLAIINDMLDISKFEAGKMKIRKSEYLLQDLLNDVVKLMAPLTARKSLDIVIDGEQLPAIRLDREKVRQVIHNLLSNAVKFAPPGSRIIMHCRHVAGGERVFQEFSISDEGPGVPLESRPYLFDKYAQVHQDVKITGTGLGLAVSQLIVAAHGGEIGYRSPGEKGSIFYFRLPVDP